MKKNHKWIIILALSVTVLVGWMVDWAKAIPSETVQWTPPKRKTSRRASESGGTRGNVAQCDQIRLDLLVPDGDGGLTTRPNPMLVWKLQAPQSVNVELKLRNIEEVRPVIQETMVSQPGLNFFQIPGSQALRLGSEYRWSVTVACSNGITEQVARGFIERIELSSQLQTDLSVGQLNSTQQAAIYARYGIWYDALTMLSHEPEQVLKLVQQVSK